MLHTYRYRAEKVEARCAELEAAIRRKDFNTFAKLTMQDSNQFHAVCLDTQPPIFYLRSVSRRVRVETLSNPHVVVQLSFSSQIIALITAINECQGTNVCAYTFDAGPNAVLYLPRKHIPLVLKAVWWSRRHLLS